jgi:DNA-binding NtrC family response regulator
VTHKILVVDDDPDLATAFSRMLSAEGYEIERASNGADALEMIERGIGIDMLLLDVHMPQMDGLELLSRVRDRGLQIPAVVISGAGTIEQAVQATRLGAFDFVQKPVQRDRLLVTVHNALRFSRLQEANTRLQAEMTSGAELIGDSRAMQTLKSLIAKVAPSDGRVLILGENGTGKELVAAAIHAASGRKHGPFIKLNCGAVARDLAESELFGHEKGSFTGAVTARKGRFELADGGTLLLDEIGDMPMPMQVKLLRVLQEGVLERVGGTRSLKVDVRVLAATNRDLRAMVEDGSFREDLYYRLNVLTLRVPPLRERKDDIGALVGHMCRPGSTASSLSFREDALAALRTHDFPGNVRELNNLVERLAILHPGEISAEQVQEILSMGSSTPRAGKSVALYRFGESLRDIMTDIERKVIAEAIAAHGNSKSAAAEALGTERSHFYKKCRQLGLTDAGERHGIEG